MYSKILRKHGNQRTSGTRRTKVVAIEAQGSIGAQCRNLRKKGTQGTIRTHVMTVTKEL